MAFSPAAPFEFPYAEPCSKKEGSDRELGLMDNPAEPHEPHTRRNFEGSWQPTCPPCGIASASESPVFVCFPPGACTENKMGLIAFRP